MSKRRADPEMRSRLLEAAAKLLAVEGPSALTTRRTAAEAGATTMAVYTHFGSIGDLVDAVVDEGFARLSDLFDDVERTDNPVADLAGLSRAYVTNALANPHLYAVMFGSASLGGYRPNTPDELSAGKYTFDEIIEATGRAIAAGQIVADDATNVAAQLWSTLHGVLMLHTAGYFGSGREAAERILVPALINLMTGLGADPAIVNSVVAQGLVTQVQNANTH
ncbi:TetR/AcrR family transcriptional regulator [Antrihabitans spumae]|jgi:AcrR family transcriptional regulator|uniref:TetR/AcrR family transcriptional regulator n=1 Tax=Antrihabitans spumae TaxID=3373370 RepID=A0ABW7K3U1_9NOCA